MRITVEHSTVYRYPAAVQLEPHTFRLRPRMTTTQWLLAVRPSHSASAGRSHRVSGSGWQSRRSCLVCLPTQELSLRSRFTVELNRENPFDFLLSDESLKLPLWYPEPLCVGARTLQA